VVSRSNLDIVAAHYAVSDRGDVDAMLADVAADVHWTEMTGFPCGGSYRSPEAVKQGVFARLGVEWADYRFALERLIDAGEHVIGIGSYSGTYRDTGKAMQARVAHVWRLAGGQVVAFEQFTDTLLVHRAMV
jgi:uncharacterized protein